MGIGEDKRYDLTWAIFLKNNRKNLTHLIINRVKTASPYMHSSLFFRVAFSHETGLQFTEISYEKSKYFTGDIAPEWKLDYRHIGPIDIDTEPPKVRKIILHVTLVLVIILVVAGLLHLNNQHQKRLRDQSQLREIKGRLAIIQNLGSQSNQKRTTHQKIKHINEDSSKSSIDDQPRKEEQYYGVQIGDNLPKVSSTNKITIQELKIIN